MLGGLPVPGLLGIHLPSRSGLDLGWRSRPAPWRSFPQLLPPQFSHPGVRPGFLLGAGIAISCVGLAVPAPLLLQSSLDLQHAKLLARRRLPKAPCLRGRAGNLSGNCRTPLRRAVHPLPGGSPPRPGPAPVLPRPRRGNGGAPNFEIAGRHLGGAAVGQLGPSALAEPSNGPAHHGGCPWFRAAACAPACRSHRPCPRLPGHGSWSMHLVLPNYHIGGLLRTHRATWLASVLASVCRVRRHPAAPGKRRDLSPAPRLHLLAYTACTTTLPRPPFIRRRRRYTSSPAASSPRFASSAAASPASPPLFSLPCPRSSPCGM